MKHLILFLLLFVFGFTSCSYLGLKSSMETAEEMSEDFDDSKEEYEEEDDEGEEEYDEEDEEEYEDEEDEDSEEDEEDSEEEDEDEEYDEDEDEEEYDEEDEETKSDGISGFFKRLFGGDESDLDEEIIDDEEGYEEIDEEGEYVEEDEEEDAEESYAEESSEEDSSDGTLQEEASFVEDSSETESFVAPEIKTPVVAKNRPLLKVKTIPYKVGIHLVNGVYIVRPNEDLQSISQTIYGTNQTGALYAINPYLSSRSVKVGDKIYYNSPNRPNDQSRILFYYDDMGITPSVYKVVPGQNIREVSSQLLGDSNSWKEIWATNPNLKSKWTISKEVIISYWPVESVKQARAPEPEPVMPEPEPVMPESTEPSDSPEALSPDLSLPETPPMPQIEYPKKQDYISLIMQNKEFFAGIFGFLVFIIFMVKMILNKRRKQREFDYTSPNIKI